MDFDKILGIGRHVLSLGGGVLVTLGLTSADQVATVATNAETIVGALMGIAGVVSSVLAKKKKKVVVVPATSAETAAVVDAVNKVNSTKK